MAGYPNKTMEELWPVALHEAAHFVVGRIVLAEKHGWVFTEPWLTVGATRDGEYGMSPFLPPGDRLEPKEEELPDLACYLAAGGAADRFWDYPPGDHGDMRRREDIGITDEVWLAARERADALVQQHHTVVKAKAEEIWEKERRIQEEESGGS